ncbi:MAG: hypothetical protein K8U57_24840 [Planctomycetes bacterium]|nr:hypothetical protein [Planctomycetota bacterium]
MDTLKAELGRLCDRYPTFSEKDLEKDENWLAVQMKSGNHKKILGVAVEQLAGKIVAAYEQEFAAFGDDEAELRVELSKKYQEHPGRFALRRVRVATFPKQVTILGCSVFTVVILLVLVFVLGIAVVSTMGTKSNAVFSKIGTSVK